MELLSSITLSTMDRADPAPVEGYATGSKLLRTYSSGAASSGHTTGPDWQHIGNVGDTFFGLFYNGSPATGKVPNFIRDAVYYAEWPASEFGSAWASADWLATASQSQVEGAPTPGGKARQGELPDIIADIFPAAATRGPGDERGDDEATNETARKDAFGAMENFEVKKHGPMAIKEWLPQEKTVAEIKKWSVDGKTGALVKLKTKIERKELTRGAQLLGAGRGLELVDYDYEKDIYSFAGRTFSAPELDEEGSTLYAQLERAVAEEREKRESEAITQTSSAPPPPPGLGPPPVSSSGSKKKPASGGDKKLPH
jgi:hypothetical protein